MSPLRCPVCGKRFQPHQTSAMPFCSERCRMVDLHRWLDEKYPVPWERPEPPQEPENTGQEPGGAK